MPRAVPRAARDDRRVRPPRARARRRQLHRVRPDVEAPGDRPDARPARHHRQGRHDATRRLLRGARAGHQGRRGLRRAGRQRASPSPLRVQLELQGPVRGGRLRVQRHVARQAAGRVHRARRPSVLGGHPGAPGVQEPPRPAAPAVPRADRRRARPTRRRRLVQIGDTAPCRHRRPRRRDRARRDGLPADRRTRGPPGHVWRVVVAEFEAPDGERFHRDIVRSPGAVGVVPLIFDRRGQRLGAARRAVPPTVRANHHRDPGRHARRRRRAARGDRPSRADRGGRDGGGSARSPRRHPAVAGARPTRSRSSSSPPSARRSSATSTARRSST